MLHALMPLAFVAAPIMPLHATFTLPLVHVILALKAITGLPLEYTKAMLHVIPKVTIILVAVWPIIFLPATCSIFESICEVTYIRRSVLPLVSAESMWLSILVITGVRVSDIVIVSALTMFKAIDKLTFESVAIFPLIDSVAIYFSIAPLSYVRFP